MCVKLVGCSDEIGSYVASNFRAPHIYINFHETHEHFSDESMGKLED